jgi:hypothetical protein
MSHNPDEHELGLASKLQYGELPGTTLSLACVGALVATTRQQRRTQGKISCSNGGARFFEE